MPFDRPRIRRHGSHMWRCDSTFQHGYGLTPQAAYAQWLAMERAAVRRDEDLEALKQQPAFQWPQETTVTVLH